MLKSLLIQSPTKFYEAVPYFYIEAQKFGFLDKYYVTSDYASDSELGSNCYFHRLEKDRQFSSNMLDLLKHVNEDVFFVCCEDHVFRPKNTHAMWQQCWDFVVDNQDVGYLRLTNNNRVEFDTKGRKDFILPMKRSYKYYISLQPGIWRREYLELALKSGEDAWKFEINGAKRCREHKGLRSYCVRETIFHHTNFFKGGKYYRHKFAEYAIDNGFALKSDRKIHWKGGTYGFEEYRSMYKKRQEGVKS